jgi:hypothetical protein
VGGITKEEEVDYCNNRHYHIGSRSNYLLCYGPRVMFRSQAGHEIEIRFASERNPSSHIFMHEQLKDFRLPHIPTSKEAKF